MVEKYFLLVFIFSTIIFIENVHTQQYNVVVRVSNMTESMKQDAIRITKQAFVKFNGYTTKSRSPLAQYITNQFNQLHKPTWQCILGRDYALSIVSENEKRIILDVGNDEAKKIAVLIFKGKC